MSTQPYLGFVASRLCVFGAAVLASAIFLGEAQAQNCHGDTGCPVPQPAPTVQQPVQQTTADTQRARTTTHTTDDSYSDYNQNVAIGYGIGALIGGLLDAIAESERRAEAERRERAYFERLNAARRLLASANEQLAQGHCIIAYDKYLDAGAVLNDPTIYINMNAAKECAQDHVRTADAQQAETETLLSGLQTDLQRSAQPTAVDAPIAQSFEQENPNRSLPDYDQVCSTSARPWVNKISGEPVNLGPGEGLWRDKDGSLVPKKCYQPKKAFSAMTCVYSPVGWVNPKCEDDRLNQVALKARRDKARETGVTKRECEALGGHAGLDSRYKNTVCYLQDDSVPAPILASPEIQPSPDDVAEARKKIDRLGGK